MAWSWFCLSGVKCLWRRDSAEYTQQNQRKAQPAEGEKGELFHHTDLCLHVFISELFGIRSLFSKPGLTTALEPWALWLTPNISNNISKWQHAKTVWLPFSFKPWKYVCFLSYRIWSEMLCLGTFLAFLPCNSLAVSLKWVFSSYFIIVLKQVVPSWMRCIQRNSEL